MTVSHTDLWTRPYVDTSCVLAVHDLNTVRAAVALGDTYKLSVPLMYDAAYHRHAVPRCALLVVVSLLP